VSLESLEDGFKLSLLGLDSIFQRSKVELSSILWIMSTKQ
jgi:hypothetical protein